MWDQLVHTSPTSFIYRCSSWEPIVPVLSGVDSASRADGVRFCKNVSDVEGNREPNNSYAESHIWGKECSNVIYRSWCWTRMKKIAGLENPYELFVCQFVWHLLRELTTGRVYRYHAAWQYHYVHLVHTLSESDIGNLPTSAMSKGPRAVSLSARPSCLRVRQLSYLSLWLTVGICCKYFMIAMAEQHTPAYTVLDRVHPLPPHRHIHSNVRTSRNHNHTVCRGGGAGTFKLNNDECISWRPGALTFWFCFACLVQIFLELWNSDDIYSLARLCCGPWQNLQESI